MRRLVLGLSIAACNGTGPWGTASVTGMPDESANSAFATVYGSDGGVPSPLTQLTVEVDDRRGALADAPACHSGSVPGFIITFDLYAGNAPSLTATTYPLISAPSCPPTCDIGPFGIMYVREQSDGGVHTATAVSGTITLTELDTENVAGNFTASIVDDQNNDSNVSGTFSGPFCGKLQ